MKEIIQFGGPRANYAGTVSETGLRVTPVNPDWFGYEVELLRANDEPWQHKQCLDLVARYGAEIFRGHDLFGWMP